MRTGLVLRVPEADPVVGRIRSRHDPAARAGMPAHVTLIYPSMDSKAFDAAARERLEAVCGETGSFDLQFARCGRFDQVLWLAPEPAGPIIALVRRLEAAFPDYPSFGGEFPEVVPHLTVAHGEPASFPALEAQLARALADPIRCRADRVAMFGLSAEGWIELERFGLGG